MCEEVAQLFAAENNACNNNDCRQLPTIVNSAVHLNLHQKQKRKKNALILKEKTFLHFQKCDLKSVIKDI